MKKIYLSMLLSGLSMLSFGQLMLTKANNSPVIGDIYNFKEYDSVVTVPKSTGANQVWDFSNCTSTLSASSKSFVVVSSAPNGSAFPTADVAKIGSAGSDTEFHSVAGANWELNGIYNPNDPLVFSFTNTAIFAAWPISFNSTSSDAFSGTATTGTTTNPANGTVTYTAAGTGTIILPGGKTFTNCLQVVREINLNMTIATYQQRQYSYYVPGLKFPAVDVSYGAMTQGTVVSNEFYIEVNEDATVLGVNENLMSLESSVIFPNPTSGVVNLPSSLVEKSSAVYVRSLDGKLIKTVEPANQLDLSSLPMSVYILSFDTEYGPVYKRVVIAK